MPRQNHEDKRRFTRFTLILPVRYVNLKTKAEGKARMRDISDKGIGLEVQEKLVVQTPLEVWLQMPDGGCFYVRGEVAWSQKLDESEEYLVGVNLKEAELKAVQLVLKAMQSRFNV